MNTITQSPCRFRNICFHRIYQLGIAFELVLVSLRLHNIEFFRLGAQQYQLLHEGGVMVSFARRATYKTMALSILILSVVGCSSNTPKPANYHIYSEADVQLNYDLAARPLSVVLNVYQLKDRQTFARLTFDDFVSGKSDTDLFAEDLLQKSELVILPGAKTEVDMKLLPETAYVGVVALYRSPFDHQWHYLIPADQFRQTNFWGTLQEKTVSIRLHDCYLNIDGVAVDLMPGQKTNASPVCRAVGTPSTPTSTAHSETPTLSTQAEAVNKAESTLETYNRLRNGGQTVVDKAIETSDSVQAVSPIPLNSALPSASGLLH